MRAVIENQTPAMDKPPSRAFVDEVIDLTKAKKLASWAELAQDAERRHTAYADCDCEDQEDR